MRLLSVALHVSAEPPALPRGRSLRRAPRGAGWSCGEAVRATDRHAAKNKTDLTKLVGVSVPTCRPSLNFGRSERSEPTKPGADPSGMGGVKHWGGAGGASRTGEHWGCRTGIDPRRRSAGLARRMPASWRDDCHAARAAACRRGTAGSSQRDSAAAGAGHNATLCIPLFQRRRGSQTRSVGADKNKVVKRGTSGTNAQCVLCPVRDAR